MDRLANEDRVEMICHEIDKWDAGLGGRISLDDLKFLIAEIGREREARQRAATYAVELIRQKDELQRAIDALRKY